MKIGIFIMELIFLNPAFVLFSASLRRTLVLHTATQQENTLKVETNYNTFKFFP